MDDITKALNNVIATRTTKPKENEQPIFTPKQEAQVADILRAYIIGVSIVNDTMQWIHQQAHVGAKAPAEVIRQTIDAVADLCGILEKLKPVVEGMTKLHAKQALLHLQIQKQIDTLDDNVFACEVDAALLGLG